MNCRVWCDVGGGDVSARSDYRHVCDNNKQRQTMVEEKKEEEYVFIILFTIITIIDLYLLFYLFISSLLIEQNTNAFRQC